MAGKPCEITAPHEWAVNIKITGTCREDAVVFGATKQQARELALALCHHRIGTKSLLDESGRAVRLPGKPPVNHTDVDDGVRADHAITVCLVDEGTGSVRLVLGDAGAPGAMSLPRGTPPVRR